MAEKKYYWLKLKKDFFKRHDIKIVEAMPNGKDYVLFYLKLLLESLDHDGNLRFSDTIPYNENMLATVTDANVDVVRSAMKLFSELNLMEILEDGTIYMAEVDKMLGSEGWSTERVRNYRVKALQCNTDVTNCNATVTKSKSKSKSKSIEIDNIDTNVSICENTQKRFIVPTLCEVTEYCKERKNSIDAQRFIDYYTANGWKVGKNAMKDWKAAIRNWESNDKQSKPKAKDYTMPEGDEPIWT